MYDYVEATPFCLCTELKAVGLSASLNTPLHKLLLHQVVVVEVVCALDQGSLVQSMCLSMLWAQLAPTPVVIPEPSHG